MKIATLIILLITSLNAFSCLNNNSNSFDSVEAFADSMIDLTGTVTKHLDMTEGKKAYDNGEFTHFSEREVFSLAVYSTGIANINSSSMERCEFTLIAPTLVATSGHCLSDALDNNTSSIELYLGASEKTGSLEVSKQHTSTEYKRVPLYKNGKPKFIRYKNTDLAIIQISEFKNGQPVEPVPSDMEKGFASIAHNTRNGVNIVRSVATGKMGLMACSMEANIDEDGINISPFENTFSAKCSSTKSVQEAGNSGSSLMAKSAINGKIYYRGNLNTDGSFGNAYTILTEDSEVEGGQEQQELRSSYIKVIKDARDANAYVQGHDLLAVNN